MEGKMNRLYNNRMKSQLFSLKTLITLLVVFCWIVPIALILISLSYYSNVQMNEKIKLNIGSKMESAIELSEQNLVNIIQESKQASYDYEIKRTYNQYLEDKNERNLYNSTSVYLNNSYQYNNNITDTMLIYNDKPEHIYYASHYKSTGGAQRIQEFTDDVLPDVIKKSEILGTDIEFLVKQNSFYIVRNIVNSEYKPFAIIVMHINSDEIFKSILNFGFTQEAVVEINNNVLYLTEESKEVFEYELDTGVEIKKRFENRFVCSNQSKIFADKYYTLINTSILGNDFTELRSFVFILIFLLLPLLAIVIYIFLYIFFETNRRTCGINISYRKGRIRISSVGSTQK